MLQSPIDETILENIMSSDEIKNLVSSYQDEIDRLTQNILDLQNECKHKEYEVKNIHEGTAMFRNVCKHCNKVVGYPTQDELNEAGY